MDKPVEVTSREFSDLVATLKLNTKAVEELTHLIRGNGQPGMLMRVDRIERAIDMESEQTISERITELEREWERMATLLSRLFWGVSIPIVLGVLGFFVAVLTHSIEIVFK